MTSIPDTVPARPGAVPWPFVRRPAHIVERNVLLYARVWPVMVSGALEAVFYLLSARVGIGALVGDVAGPGGRAVTYVAFVAPALLASSAANGAVYDTTFNFYFKLRAAKLYDAILATPLSTRDVAIGELAWAVVRGGVHSVLFLLVMGLFGLLDTWWVLVTLPAVTLVSFSFGAIGLAATTYVRSWRDFDWQQMVWMPMFLLSASFFPLSVYPEWCQWLVRVTPLYQGVAMLRSLLLGGVGWTTLGHAVYLAAVGAFAVTHAARRMGRILLH